MIDRFGRTIDYLRVSVTDRCNLRCTYCMPAEGVIQKAHADMLSFEEILRTVRIGADCGIKKIKLTGGEPLVRRGFTALASELTRIPGIEDVTLTTNGILLPQYMSELYNAGIRAYNISLDTVDAKKYHTLTRIGTLADVYAGIDAALSYPDTRVKLNAVLSDQTPEELKSLAGYAEKKGVALRFIEMMPVGQTRRIEADTCAAALCVLEDMWGKSYTYNQKLGNGPAEYVGFAHSNEKIGFIRALSHSFCSSCSRLRLTSEGFLKSCLLRSAGVDIRSILRNPAALDNDLALAFQRAADLKPCGHTLLTGASPEPGLFTMNQTGG